MFLLALKNCTFHFFEICLHYFHHKTTISFSNLNSSHNHENDKNDKTKYTNEIKSNYTLNIC